MKKQRLLLLLVCVSISLVGCMTKEGKNSDEEVTKNPMDKEPVSTIEWVKPPFGEYAQDPIPLYDKGFIVNDGAKEGFMDPQGTLLLDMNYKFQPCFMQDAYGVMEGVDELTYLSQLLDVQGYDQGCWTGIVGPFVDYYYDNQSKIIMEHKYDMESSSYHESPVELQDVITELKKDTFFLPVDLNIVSEEGKEESKTNKGYVLVAQGNLITDSVYEDIHMKQGYRAYDILEPLNAVKKDGNWALMNEQGTLLSEFVYDTADILNDEYVKVKKGNAVGLFTKNQKVYLYENITSITAPSQHVVFVKQNDLWGLMKFENEK